MICEICKFFNPHTDIQYFKRKKCPFITKETFTLDKGKKKKKQIIQKHFLSHVVVNLLIYIIN